MARFVESINAALHTRLLEDAAVRVLGADIADPYGGAFKASRGLSSDFPDRVISTPVSEAALVGLASGMALGGLRPIVEVMFGDFLGLVFDQLFNHASKFGPVYGAESACPIIVRTPVGAGRGYGPTHSQCPEKHFLGIPGVKVVALGPHSDALSVFRSLQMGEVPALIVEAKTAYGESLRDASSLIAGGWHVATFELGGLPALSLSPVSPDDCCITICGYGTMAVRLERIVWDLAVEREIFCQLIVPSTLNADDLTPLASRLAPTGRVLMVEEGAHGWHWGAGWQCELGRIDGHMKVASIASQSAAVPSGIQHEPEVILQDPQIEQAILNFIRGI